MASTQAPLGPCERLLNALSLAAAFRFLRRAARRSPAEKKEPPFTVRTVEIEPGTPSPTPTAAPKPSQSPATAPPNAGGGRTATEKKAVVEMGLERGKAQQTEIGPEIGNGPKSVASPSIPGPGLASSNDHEIGREKRGLAKAKSDINERVEEYIKRTKMKFRTPTGIVGKPST